MKKLFPVLILLCALIADNALRQSSGQAWAGFISQPTSVTGGTGCTSSGSSILKGDGAGGCANASSGTDYLATGAITSIGVTMATARLLGRTTASTGAVEAISVGASLTLSATTLGVATGGVTNAMLAGSIAASKFVGTDIATLGTVTAGTWQGSVIGGTYGGLGANAAAFTGVLAMTSGVAAVVTGTGTDCVLVNGTSSSCGSGGGGDVSSNTATSVNSEVALFSGTGGKTIKRATGTGIPLITAGVFSIAVAGTDYLLPSGSGAALTALNATQITSGTFPAARFPAFTGDVTNTAGTIALAIGASKVTNTMLAGAIAASKLVATDIVTVGTITTGTWQGTTVAFNKGGTNLTAAADDTVMVSSGTAWEAKAVPNCGDSTHALAYDTSTNSYSCQAITATGTPGGSTTQVQFNDAGALGGDAGMTYVKATDTLNVVGAINAGSVGFTDTSKSAGINLQGLTSGSVALAVKDIAGTAITYVLPSTNLSANQFLMNNGSVTCPTLNAAMPTTCHELIGVSSTGTSSVVRATTPTLVTPILGAATATSINGLTISTSTGVFTLTNSKTFAVTNTLTLSGTDGTVMTFPSTSATIARTDAANTFTGIQTMTSANLITPTIGVATATSVNKLTITAPATSATLTIANGKTLTVSNTLTFTGTDSSSVAFGAGGTVVYTGAATGSGITLATARLLGRTTASTGAIEEISVGTGLTLSAGSLTNAGVLSVAKSGSAALVGAVTFTGGTNVTLTQSGNDISIAAAGGAGTGCVPIGTVGQLLTDSGAGACTSQSNFTIASSVLTLGSGGSIDMAAASVTAGLKIPTAAGAVPTADGFIAINSTNHTHVWGSNGSTMVAAIAATSTGTATTCSNQFVRAVSGVAVPTCATVASADIASNAVTSAKLAVVNTRKTCTMVIGADNGSALADADIGPQGRQCFIPAASTVVEVTVAADGGTPNVIPRRNVAGTGANLVSSALATAAAGALACSKTTAVTGIDGATTCSATLQNTALAAGSWLEIISGTAGGTAKRMSVAVTYTVD